MEHEAGEEVGEQWRHCAAGDTDEEAEDDERLPGDGGVNITDKSPKGNFGLGNDLLLLVCHGLDDDRSEREFVSPDTLRFKHV